MDAFYRPKRSDGHKNMGFNLAVVKPEQPGTGFGQGIGMEKGERQVFELWIMSYELLF